METRVYSAAGGVIIQGDQMLLLDRPSRGEVRLPKGHIEPGELPAETALREVREETGLKNLEIVADLGVQQVDFDYKNAHYERTEYYFLMRMVDSTTVDRPPKDAKDFHPMWKPLGDALATLTYDPERRVAEQAIAAYRDALTDN